MKKLAILCGIIAALLCLTQNASAQYARRGVNIVDNSGFVLSDSQLINLVGQDVFDQTVVGARKQYKAGNGLLWGGLAGTVVGIGGAAFAMYKLTNDAGIDVNDMSSAMEEEPGLAALYIGSYALASVGASLFTAGIVLKSIGKSRLNWVGEQANAAKGYTLNVGPTRHGVGLSVTF